MKVLIFFITALFIQPALAKSETKTFPAKGLKTLKVINISGNIAVASASNESAQITSQKKFFPKRCSIASEKSGPTLKIEVKDSKRSTGRGKSCEVNLSIVVPANVSIDVIGGSGNLSIKETKGSINFKLGSGNASIASVITEMEGVTGSGNISASKLHGSATVRTGSGNIKLSYSKVPPSGDLQIKTGSGNATIKVPAGSKLITDFSAGSGKVTNAVGVSKGAKFKVTMRAGSGDLKIVN